MQKIGESDTLIEDFDLFYRAQLMDWKFRYFVDLENPANLPSIMQSFQSQQFRWYKGSIHTVIKFIPKIIKANLPFLMILGVEISISNTKAFLEALLDKKSTFERISKYKIESKYDSLSQRQKYFQKLNSIIVVECIFFLYCILTAYYAYQNQKYLIIPFFIYTIGFLYVVFLSVIQNFTLRFVYLFKRFTMEL